MQNYGYHIFPLNISSPCIKYFSNHNTIITPRNLSKACSDMTLRDEWD